MSGIKYYQLAKGEEMPDEFCVVRDVDGEPSEYVFYVPDAENDKLRKYVTKLEMALDASTARVDELCRENERLRGLVRELYGELDAATQYDAGGGRGVVHEFADRMRELGVNDA